VCDEHAEHWKDSYKRPGTVKWDKRDDVTQNGTFEAMLCPQCHVTTKGNKQTRGFLLLILLLIFTVLPLCMMGAGGR
jgi:hypothetical protein